MQPTYLRILTILVLVNIGSLSAQTLSTPQHTAVITSPLTKDPFPLKNAKSYNESNDPAFRRCGTNSDGPQHGFFAVPVLVLGLAGVLLYFSKSN